MTISTSNALSPKVETAEVERAVIGSVLLDPMVMDEVYYLEPDEFQDPRNRLIWRVLKYLYECEEPIELASLLNMLAQYKRIEEAGGVLYVSELSDGVATAKHAAYYADQLRKAAALQKARDELFKLSAEAQHAGTQNYEEIMNKISALADTITPDETKGMRHIGEMEEEFFTALEREEVGIKTGFEKFDEWSGGVRRGWLYIIAGRPSAGKTAYMLQMAAGIAEQEEGAVLIWSQEMDYNQILTRMISCETGIPYRMLTRDKTKLTAAQKQLARQKFEELKKLPFYCDDTSGKTIEEIKAVIRQFKRRKGKIAAVFVDYLQIMDITPERGGTMAQAIGKVTRMMKQIARNENLCFVCLSQLNRENERDSVPKMSHLKESGAIEQDADVIQFLYQHPNDAEKDAGVDCRFVRSRFVKGRDLGVKEFKCVFEGWRQRFDEIGEADMNEKPE